MIDKWGRRKGSCIQKNDKDQLFWSENCHKFCNHPSEDWISQGSSIYAKSDSFLLCARSLLRGFLLQNVRASPSLAQLWDPWGHQGGEPPLPRPALTPPAYPCRNLSGSCGDGGDGSSACGSGWNLSTAGTSFWSPVTCSPSRVPS